MNINQEILIDFLCGNTDEETQRLIEQWYASSEENQKTLENIYYILFLNDRLQIANEINTEKSLSELKRRIAARTQQLYDSRTQQSHNSKTPPVKRFIFRWSQIAIAAVFVGVILIGGSILKTISDKAKQEFVVSTKLGEHSHIILPDGSKVWLNSLSRITYTSSLFSKERKVEMVGEAYFEVQHDKNAPFIVNSRKLSTAVLGTKFNIRANEDDAYITTTLLEGLIAVSETDALDNKNIILKPDQQLKYDYNTGNSVILECHSSKDYICWIDNKLYFENIKLSEIVKDLERHYNVNFTFASEKIKGETFTCDFDSNESIYQILSILKLTGKLDYKINGKMIMLYSEKQQ